MKYHNGDGTGTWPSIATYKIAIYIEGLRTMLTVSDSVVNNGEIGCFDATGNVIITGNTDLVEFYNGSSVDIIAGNSISFLPGFHAYEGSLIHASITRNAIYCSNSVENNNNYKSTLVNDKISTIEQLNKKQGIKVYPNPNNGYFTVELNNINTGSEVYIYDLLGAKIFDTTIEDQTSSKINLSKIKKGIYIVKVVDRNQQFTKKMIVN